MRTMIGNFLRQIRLDHQELLKDMAKKLGVSSAFLSAVENGKKKIPKGWNNKLIKAYNLSAEQVDNLEKAILESENEVRIDLNKQSAENRELAISFARHFDSIDKETAEKLIDMLKKYKKE